MVGGQPPCGSARQWPSHPSGRFADGRVSHVGEQCNFHERLPPVSGVRHHTSQKRWTGGATPRNVSAKGATSDQQYCPREVQFVVPVQVNFGDCVKVVGNESALGCWDCTRALPLQWNEGNIWTQKVDLNPGAYEFKCVVAGSDGATKWEPGSNRSIEVPPEVTRMEVSCEWWNTQKTSSSIASASKLIDKNLVAMEASILGMPVEKELLTINCPSSVPKESNWALESLHSDEGRLNGETKTGTAEWTRQTVAEPVSGRSDPEKCMMNGNGTNRVDAVGNGMWPRLCKSADESDTLSVAGNLQMPESTSGSSSEPLQGPLGDNHLAGELPNPLKEKSLSLVASGHIIPHLAKRLRGGEDAYFVSTAGLGGMGVADGVGSWAQEGVDPARYPRILIGYVARALNKSEGAISPKKALAYAQKQAVVLGSCTICIGLLREGNVMEFANLGDCGFRIIREGRTVHASEVQQHKFNHPFQMSHPTLAPGDSASDAEVYKVPVEMGDIVLMGTDGLFHNIWDDDLGSLVEGMMKEQPRTEMTARTVAAAVAENAHKNAQDPQFRSPLSECSCHQQDGAGDGSSQDTSLPEAFLGGKMDDCTVVVGFIGSS